MDTFKTYEETAIKTFSLIYNVKNLRKAAY